MNAPNTLHVVEGGDHSLQMRKGDLTRTGKTQAAVDAEILSIIRTFITSALSTAGV